MRCVQQQCRSGDGTHGVDGLRRSKVRASRQLRCPGWSGNTGALLPPFGGSSAKPLSGPACRIQTASFRGHAGPAWRETMANWPEEFKAWSQNLGHEKVMNDFYQLWRKLRVSDRGDHKRSGRTLSRPCSRMPMILLRHYSRDCAILVWVGRQVSSGRMMAVASTS